MKTGPLALSLMLVLGADPALAVVIVNSGFNDTTGWTLANDATLAHPGGTAPWSWNTPVVASTVVNASETVLPLEGTGMGITYAGLDSFTQSVNFANSGDYIFSLSANGITGTGTNGLSLVDGAFKFLLGAVSSSIMTVPTAGGWSNYTWTTNVTAGTHMLGFENTKSAVYAIAYDTFTVTAVDVHEPTDVPEPTTFALLSLGLGGFGFSRRKTS